MTKKDFELLAAIIREDAAHIVTHLDGSTAAFDYGASSQWSKGAYDQWNTLVLSLADALATTNPRFDRARFLQACGVAS